MRGQHHPGAGKGNLHSDMSTVCFYGGGDRICVLTYHLGLVARNTGIEEEVAQAATPAVDPQSIGWSRGGQKEEESGIGLVGERASEHDDWCGYKF